MPLSKQSVGWFLKKSINTVEFLLISKHCFVCLIIMTSSTQQNTYSANDVSLGAGRSVIVFSGQPKWFSISKCCKQDFYFDSGVNPAIQDFHLVTGLCLSVLANDWKANFIKWETMLLYPACWYVLFMSYSHCMWN